MSFQTLFTRRYGSALVLSSGKAPFFKKWVFVCVIMHADILSTVADSAQAVSVHGGVGGRCCLNCKIMFRFVQIPALKIKVVPFFFRNCRSGSDASRPGSRRFYPQPHDCTCSLCFVNISGNFAGELVVTHKAARSNACLWKWDKINGSPSLLPHWQAWSFPGESVEFGSTVSGVFYIYALLCKSIWIKQQLVLVAR